ncbi:multiple sugar transport system permease protein [Friedmanniella endophytica]|uniref:Multiple sugar transport system permease protein n=1 Tax=Microlunatus kandeliicorticis TaxID=1759536 RepID=A0A7W3IVG7_9ACTN|nr:sugar ABC transporter permease [Microlunatus kandeliicorticis]MBA8796028.1 multiple sugar transport system permease protein [Microlunatus kandeliicorticis]
MTATQTGGTLRVPARTTAGTSSAARGWRRYRPATFYGFIAPWLAGFVLLTLFPLGYALWLSTTNYDGMTGRYRYVGLDNYTAIASDPDALHALARTGLYTLGTVPLSIAFGLLLAVLLNQQIRARGAFRALIYLPAVVPIVGSALCFKMLFNADFGAVNAVIGLVGIPPVDWLSDPGVFVVLVAVTLWGVGASMIISLSGLQGIPRELQEAARVDGAGAWQVFSKITLPLLSPIILFQVITGIIGSVQGFVAPLLLTASSGTASVTSVPQSTYLYMIHVYAQYFAYGRFGYASALLWVLFVLILLLTVVIFRVSARAVFYENAPDTPTRRRRTRETPEVTR